MAVREVAFELECFEWADERLEVAGRWKGVAGRRLNRPVLTVETGGGRRKHLAALPGGHYGGGEEPWRAAFAWTNDPGEITAAELEVGGAVVVDLPLPDRRRRRRKRTPADAGDETLRAETTALRAQVERLRAELAGRERENMQLQAQLEEQSGEGEAIADIGDATVEIERLTGERDEFERLAGERESAQSELAAEIQRLHAERDHVLVELQRLRDENEHARSNVDDLREAFADAAAEAEEVRDRHRAQVQALEDELHEERAAVARLTAQLAAGPELPPPTTPSARRAAGGGTTAAAADAVAADAPARAADADAGDDSTLDATLATDESTAPAAGDAEPAIDEPAASAADEVTAEASPATEDPTAPESAPVGGEPADSTASEAAARAAAAAPPTAPFAAPAADRRVEAPPPIGETASVPGVLDPPGPIRAAGRPSAQPAADDTPRTSRIPAWLRGEESDRPSGPPFQAVKDKLEGLFTSNGRAVADDEEEAADPYDPVPGPRRTAAAARARAEATVAARRSAAEMWALRVLAALLVAVLLIAFLLILTSIA